VGNHAIRLQVNRELNPTNPAYLSTLPVRDPAAISFLTRTSPNPFAGINSVYGQTITRAQLLRPYPQFNNIQELEPVGHSMYHSLQTQVQKRFSRGFTINLSHTWSKLLDGVAFLNPADPSSWYGISQYDRPSRLAINGLWEVPVGRGRLVGGNMPKWLDTMVGGLQIAGHVVRQSGQALDLGNIIFNGDPDSIALPNGSRSASRWFNVDAGFNRSAAAQLANNIRTFPLRFTSLRGDGQATWNFSGIKNISLTERTRLQLRADSFNALNHPNFNLPNVTPTAAAFGTISSQNGGGRQFTVAGRIIF
jgi:hypothetical protein